VASVLAQTVRDWELVIVDDGSTDGTADVAAALTAIDSRISVVSQANSGIARARNRGLAAISKSSRFVALLDHDDFWMPNTLEVLRDALLRWPAASAAHGVAASIDESGRPLKEKIGEPGLPGNRFWVVNGRVEPWPVDRPTVFAVLAYEDCIVGMGSALIRRSALDRIGDFDWRAEPADDYDFWVRLSRVGEIPFLNAVVLVARLHGSNRSLGPAPPRGQGSGYVRHKLIVSPENTREQRRLAIQGFRAHERMLLEQRWTNFRSAWRRREYRTLPRQLATAAVRIASYARGCPWLWQR
jgi:glycosyltransferase involved in cell wall biosynthesis